MLDEVGLPPPLQWYLDGARKACIRLALTENQIAVRVSDDGKGLPGSVADISMNRVTSVSIFRIRSHAWALETTPQIPA
jgi:hypothetical protein